MGVLLCLVSSLSSLDQVNCFFMVSTLSTVGQVIFYLEFSVIFFGIRLCILWV